MRFAGFPLHYCCLLEDTHLLNKRLRHIIARSYSIAIDWSLKHDARK